MHEVECAIYPVVQFVRHHISINVWDAAKVIATANLRLKEIGKDAENDELAKIILSVPCDLCKKNPNMEGGIRISEWDALDAVQAIQKVLGYGIYSVRLREKLTGGNRENAVDGRSDNLIY